MECLECHTADMSVLNLSKHLDGQRHKKKIRALFVRLDGVQFVCRLCSDSPSGGKECQCGHVDSPVHREKLVEELPRFRVWPHRFLRASPEEVECQVELARDEHVLTSVR